MKFGSVCSGIEAATVAWEPLGFRAAWLSEIEPFCCALLNHHYPDTPNLGDITKITEADLDGPIDILVGGTPCQSFSVAGLRKGMADPRGNLALRFLQLAGATRAAWCVWENVPGVLSSNKGRDFAAVLGGLEKLGYGWAYRILDAQYFGVPQRRRRVFVVGHLGDWRRAAAVLFERSCLCGHPSPSREAGAGVAHSLARGACGSHGRYDPNGEDYIVGPIQSHSSRHGHAMTTQQAAESGQLVAFDTTQVTSPGNYSEPKPGQPCHPLAKGQHPPSVCIPLDMRQASRGDKMTNNRREGSSGGPPGTGIGEQGDPSPSIAETHPPAVAYQQHGSDVGPMGSLRRGQGDVQSGVPFVFNWQAAGKQTTLGANSETAATLEVNQGQAIGDGMAVRRLTPRECERLQGFPDDYTKIPYRNKPAEECPDGPRYRALGNSMAVPVMRWIGQRILLVMEDD